MARPKVKSEQKALNLRIDAKVYKELDKQSIKSGVPKTTITEKALSAYLKMNRKEKELKG